jgi:hypothetical protein
MAAHPTITAMAARLMPASFNDFFMNASDFWIYLIGPVWMFWLTLKAEWHTLREIAVYAMATPLVVISLFLLVRRNNNYKTVLFGFLMCVLVLSPVLILPASKTMLHNFYVPAVGMALVVGEFVRGRRFPALLVPALLVSVGVYYLATDLDISWPTTTARAANRYLEDVKRFHHRFPKGAIQYFETTGMPNWPFLTGGGDLFRVFYGDQSLVTMFGDYGHAAPESRRRNPPIFRFRETDGTLLPIQ